MPLDFRQHKIVRQRYCRKCRSNLWLKFRQRRCSHFPDYIVINLLIVEDVNKVIPYPSQLMPRYFWMNRLEIFRDMRRSLADGRYVKRRCILKFCALQEFILGNTGKHFVQTLDSIQHVKKSLNVFVHAINHISDISLRTL